MARINWWLRKLCPDRKGVFHRVSFCEKGTVTHCQPFEFHGWAGVEMVFPPAPRFPRLRFFPEAGSFLWACTELAEADSFAGALSLIFRPFQNDLRWGFFGRMKRVVSPAFFRNLGHLKPLEKRLSKNKHWAEDLCKCPPLCAFPVSVSCKRRVVSENIQQNPRGTTTPTRVR